MGGVSASALVPSSCSSGRDHAAWRRTERGHESPDVIGRDMGQIARQHHDGPRAARRRHVGRRDQAPHSSRRLCPPGHADPGRASAAAAGHRPVTTAMRSGLNMPSVAVSTRPNSRRLSAARSSTPSNPASRDLPARNGLTGMIAQQSITLFHCFRGQFEGQLYRIVRQTTLVVERAHHGIADLDPAAERFDSWCEIAIRTRR